MYTHKLIIPALTCLSVSAFADDTHPIEEVTVLGNGVITQTNTLKPAVSATVDSADILKQIPGANVNTNGALTGVAQYRGMYGSRLNVHIDDANVIGGGPNSMDPPLSNISAHQVATLKVSRGLAPVSSGQETLGGHIEAESHQGEFADGDHIATHGSLLFNSNRANRAQNLSAFMSAATQQHKIAISAQQDEAEDIEIADHQRLRATEYERRRGSLHYGFQSGDREISANFAHNETEQSGTPALPMDIQYIDSDLGAIKYSDSFNGMTLEARINYGDVIHGMDNFSLRPIEMPMMNSRVATASGRNLGYSIELQSIPLLDGALTVGLDHHESEHSTVIKNPMNANFTIVNINNAQKSIDGIYAEWSLNQSAWNYEFGVRANTATLKTHNVSAQGMMGMMGMRAAELANTFNSGDRDNTLNTIDWVFKSDYQYSEHLKYTAALGRKSRSPEYIEMFLWLPLETSGGLADGQRYIGNLNLDEEVAHEINLGIEWTANNLSLNPQLFYREVHDYIQGTPSANMTANMLSTMMSGSPALQFNNIDARLYGLDMQYVWAFDIENFDGDFSLSGTINYVKGRRTDEKDNLYRIAPFNMSVLFGYKTSEYSAGIELISYAKQADVSRYNNEQVTPGYTLLNILGHYNVYEHAVVRFGIQNLTDKRYQNHLAGYNRVGDSAIDIGERIVAPGRNAYIQVEYTF